jgi:hypothetical protein
MVFFGKMGLSHHIAKGKILRSTHLDDENMEVINTK